MNHFSLAETKAIVRSIVEPIVTAKRDRTVAAIYERCRPDENGFLHTTFAVDTATMRLSSAASPFFTGGNLQNIPKKTAGYDPLYRVRDIFIAEPGKLLLSVDYAGAESVCVAAYSQDWPYLDALLAGQDTHSDLAALFFGERWERAEKGSPDRKLMREIAKQIRYASFYHATVPTITRTLNREGDRTGVFLTEEEVRTFRRIILDRHPLEAWWQAVSEELHQSGGVLRNCFGFRRVFHDPDDDHRLKQALSFLPQSTVAWLMLENLLLLQPLLQESAILFDLQVHDELRFRASPAAIPSFVRAATPILERTFLVHGHPVHIPVEWKVGASWGTMRVITPETVEDVLREF
jgi:DNA polymerase-1